MNITKETEVVNLRQKGGKIISEDNLDYFFLLYITYKKQFTTILFCVCAKLMKKCTTRKSNFVNPSFTYNTLLGRRNFKAGGAIAPPRF